ncbi:MAG: hypothetical protein HOP21_10910 [Methylotenera sp.]|nr:hypothetical protein [Methylotenera sp.]
MANGETIREKIIALCVQALAQSPSGLRFAEIKRYVQTHLDPAIKQTNIPANLVKLVEFSDGTITKIDKGFYQLTANLSNSSPEVFVQLPLSKKITEQDFYQPFADWLVTELEDCTKTEVVGGATFGDKWATPDVIGVLKSKPSDIFKFEHEIVAAEIKISGGESLITALGQACSYRLFAHRSYIVVPKQANKADLDRLDSLCLLFGIGLVLFDVEHPDNPEFLIKTRALTHKPDMFYLNHYLGKSGLGDKLLS